MYFDGPYDQVCGHIVCGLFRYTTKTTTNDGVESKRLEEDRKAAYLVLAITRTLHGFCSLTVQDLGLRKI